MKFYTGLSRIELTEKAICGQMREVKRFFEWVVGRRVFQAEEIAGQRPGDRSESAQGIAGTVSEGEMNKGHSERQWVGLYSE